MLPVNSRYFGMSGSRTEPPTPAPNAVLLEGEPIRARHARNVDAVQHIVGAPLQPVDFIVAPAGVVRDLLDDVRSLIGGDGRAGQEAAARVVEVDHQAVDETA